MNSSWPICCASLARATIFLQFPLRSRLCVQSLSRGRFLEQNPHFITEFSAVGSLYFPSWLGTPVFPTSVLIVQKYSESAQRMAVSKDCLWCGRAVSQCRDFNFRSCGDSR